MGFARGFKIIAAALVIAGIAGLLVRGFLQGRKELAAEQERERPVKAPSRVSVKHGETVITLDAAAQKMNGIITKVLARTSRGARKRQAGAVVPDAAVVWLDGKAWAYTREGRNRFVRREVSITLPRGKGWFVTKNFSAGDRVVVRGAQLLLSEEFRSQIQIKD